MLAKFCLCVWDEFFEVLLVFQGRKGSSSSSLYSLSCHDTACFLWYSMKWRLFLSHPTPHENGVWIFIFSHSKESLSYAGRKWIRHLGYPFVSNIFRSILTITRFLPIITFLFWLHDDDHTSMIALPPSRRLLLFVIFTLHFITLSYVIDSK